MTIDEAIKRRVLDLCNKPVALGGWLGLPYEQEDCLKFAVRVLREIGLDVTEEAMKEARNFRKVDEPQFGDVVIFHAMPSMKFHVGIMLDHRKAIQCSEATGGAGKIDVYRQDIREYVKGFRRHAALCF